MILPICGPCSNFPNYPQNVLIAIYLGIACCVNPVMYLAPLNLVLLISYLFLLLLLLLSGR